METKPLGKKKTIPPVLPHLFYSTFTTTHNWLSASFQSSDDLSKTVLCLEFIEIYFFLMSCPNRVLLTSAERNSSLGGKIPHYC